MGKRNHLKSLFCATLLCAILVFLYVLTRMPVPSPKGALPVARHLTGAKVEHAGIATPVRRMMEDVSGRGKTMEDIWAERALLVTEKERIARILRQEFRWATATSVPIFASLPKLGLSVEQEDCLLGLLVSAQHVGFDENGKRLAVLKGKSSEEQEVILRAETARIENQIRGLVGDDVYQRYLAERTYEIPTRPYLTEFYGESYLRGVALGTEQLQAIENLPRRIGADATQEALNSYPDPITGLNWADELIIQHLTDVLSPAQIDILREVFEDRNFFNVTGKINKARAGKTVQYPTKTGS